MYKMPYIFPNLVMKLIENNFIVGDAIVPENGFGFGARRVHMVQVFESPEGKRVQLRGIGIGRRRRRRE
jgi:hypothetical protein